MKAAADQVSGRRVVLDAEDDIEPSLPEGQLPDVGESEGLRRADRGPVRALDARDHNGAPLRGESTPVRGFGGGASVRPLLRQRRGSRGFEGGRSIPRQSPVCTHGVGWPTTKLACQLWRFAYKRTAVRPSIQRSARPQLLRETKEIHRGAEAHRPRSPNSPDHSVRYDRDGKETEA